MGESSGVKRVEGSPRVGMANTPAPLILSATNLATLSCTRTQYKLAVVVEFP